MGKDWRTILERASTPLAADHVPTDYGGQADPVFDDPE